MKIRIVSDGLSRNTRVENVETGELLECVYHVDWQAGGSEETRVLLELVGVPVIVEGKVEQTHTELRSENPVLRDPNLPEIIASLERSVEALRQRLEHVQGAIHAFSWLLKREARWMFEERVHLEAERIEERERARDVNSKT